MKITEIVLGTEYVARRSEYDTPNHVRTVEIVAVDPPPTHSRWIASRHHVLPPGEANYGVRGLEKRVRVEVLNDDGVCYLGDRDIAGRRWLPPRLFVSTWEAWAAQEAAKEAAEAKAVALRQAQRTAWGPLIDRAKTLGLVREYEPTPACDAPSVTFDRETLARVLDALDAIAERR